ASLQSDPGLLEDQAQFSKRRPVPLEQPDEILLASGFHAIGTDDNLIVCFRHARYLAFMLSDDQDLRLGGSVGGAPCGIRTHGPRIRNPVLYPSELRG